MNILVTGSTGFIGKHLVPSLIHKGFNVYVSQRKNSASNIVGEIKGSHIFGESIQSDIEFLQQNKIEGIIHLATDYKANHQASEVAGLIDNNIKFGAMLLEASVQAGVKWFLNTGTFWQHYIADSMDYCPANLYAATKQAFEDIAKYYIETNSIFFITLKLCDTFGKNDTRNKIFNLWQKIAASGEVLQMSGGEQKIDILYIDDVISAFGQLIELLQTNSAGLKNGNSFAAKAQARYTLKELAHIFKQVTGSTLHIEWGKRPYREREVMIPWEKGIAIPGWSSTITIEEGLQRFIS